MMIRAGLFFFLVSGLLFSKISCAQNTSINVLTLNSGVVKKGELVFFEVTVNNTDPEVLTGVYKLKVQVSIADSNTIVIKTDGHNLPTGWQIIENTGTIITLSNGKDIIAPNDARKLLIALEGKKIGGPIMIVGHLHFSNGLAPGSEPGVLSGDNPADNFSTSTCIVTN